MAANYEDGLLSTSKSKHGLFNPAVVGTRAAVPNVNSTAVVQAQPNMLPVQFHTIRLNTDLNRLPHDWSKTKFPRYGLNNSHSNSFSAFTSVNLAHNYKDLVGRVDVISSSKNIKDLLKMPYQKSPHISLMVHRLGKTLLLEEFDVHKNLIKKDAEEWKWLNDFFRRYVNKHEDKNSSLALLNSPKKDFDFLSDEMYRNLIRHSISASVASNACISLDNHNEVPGNIPHIEEESQDLKGFHHESVWKFHDRSMLVDSDLPIFGTDSKCPCISLRLRDSPPINILTGLDYWLDNLMSNVPEVAMVYHINGFVQKYEILRTEDIPNIENSKFDPEEVMDLARNMMAFIKSRAVVEGHTYWLYKSEQDDMVKLYDLTDYCKNEFRQDDNPFMVPVGVLCYHVGRNLKMSGQRRSADCRAMLENCLRLLIEEKHPQICADAHFLLSDMWVPDKSLHDIWQGEGKIPDTPDDLYDEEESNFDGSGGESESDDFYNEAKEELRGKNLVSARSLDKRLSPQKSPKKKENKNEVALQELVVRGMIKSKAWDVVKTCRIAGETDERCQEALSHVRQGLGCIDKDLARLSRSNIQFNIDHRNQHQDRFSSNVDVERDQIRVAMPFVPIPLHYSPINTKGNDTNGDNSHSSSNSQSFEGQSHSSKSGGESSEDSSHQSQENESTPKSFSRRIIPWHQEYKLDLLRKAAIAFCILANQFHVNLMKRGHTLRYVRYGLHCYECLFFQKLKQDPDALEEEIYFQLIHLAARARSCMDMTVWTASQKDYKELDEKEAAILHSAQSILQTPKEAWVYKWPETEEENLQTAVELFKKVMTLQLFDKKPPEQRKAVKNQMNVCKLNYGKVLCTEMKQRIGTLESFESINTLIQRAKLLFEEAAAYFLKTNDSKMAAHCTLCLSELFEHAAAVVAVHNGTEQYPICKEEYQLIQKMADACEKTLSMYGRDEQWDIPRENIYKRLRNKYFDLGCRFFKAKTLTTEVYKSVREFLGKSLKYCFLDQKSSYGENSCRIGAIVHYNLAIFDSTEIKSFSNDSPQYRALRRKLGDHIKTAYNLYGALHWAKSQIMVGLYLASTMEKEFECKHQTPKTLKRAIKSALISVCQLTSAIKLIHQEEENEEDDCVQYATPMDAIQDVLDVINRFFRKWLSIGKPGDANREMKGFYMKSLQLTKASNATDIAGPLSDQLENLSQYLTDLNV